MKFRRLFGSIQRIYDALVLRHPGFTLLLLASVFAVFAWNLPNFRLDASADSLLLENDRDLRLFRQLGARYGTREFLFIAFTPEADLFAPESLRVIRKLRDSIAQLPSVESIVSMLDVPLTQQVEGGISAIAENIRTLEDPDVDLSRARQELLESPIYSELVISADGRSTGMQINLVDSPRFRKLLTERDALLQRRYSQGGLDAEARRRMEQVVLEYQGLKRELERRNSHDIQRIREIIEPWKQYGKLHLGGVPMIVDDMISYIRSDLVIFGVSVFAFLVVMLGLIFRHPCWVLLPLGSCLYAGILMIGLLGMMDWQVTVISSNFISLMLIITMSINIHLIVRYRQLRADFPQLAQRELVLRTTSLMVWPCLFTVLTTMLAFSSLVVSGIKPVIHFGWMMTLGLCVSFVSSFLLFPSLLMLMPRLDAVASGPDRSGFTTGLAGLTLRHGNALLLLSGLLAVFSFWGVSRLEVENSFVNYFSRDTEIYQGLKIIDEQLGGTTPLEVVLDLSEEPEPVAATVEGDELEMLFSAFEESDRSETAWLSLQRLDTIKAVHDYLDSLPAVGKVLSLASVFRVGERINQGEFDEIELAVMSKNVPEFLRTTMFDPYVSEINDEARISARVMDSMPELRRQALLEQIRSELPQKLGLSEGKFQLSGLMVLYNNMLQSLFQSQIKTLGTVMLGITLMLLVLFRSLLLAVLGIIPNLLAAAVILGLMGAMNIPLDMMTITIAAITIGIATDNSIHYIYRFGEELPRFHDYTTTMRHCHANIGKAMFYTAVTIIVGFSILMLSNFIPTIYFGLFTALAMIIALFAALTLLPRLILLCRPF